MEPWKPLLLGKLSLFLGAFAELRQAAISFVMYAHPCFCPHGTTRLPLDGFAWNVMSIFRKSVDKILVSLKSDKNNGYFTWRPIYIFNQISLNSSYKRNISRKSCSENQNTHFMFSYFFFENRAVYEILWKIMYSRTGHRWQYGACACVLDT